MNLICTVFRNFRAIPRQLTVLKVALRHLKPVLIERGSDARGKGHVVCVNGRKTTRVVRVCWRHYHSLFLGVVSHFSDEFNLRGNLETSTSSNNRFWFAGGRSGMETKLTNTKNLKVTSCWKIIISLWPRCLNRIL